MFLLFGWIAFAAVVRQASLIEADAALFDPYKILGLSVVSNEPTPLCRLRTPTDTDHTLITHAGIKREGHQEALPQDVAQVVSHQLLTSSLPASTRELTLLDDRSHPDKIQLADNQTKIEADNMYIELTKAYKA